MFTALEHHDAHQREPVRLRRIYHGPIRVRVDSALPGSIKYTHCYYYPCSHHGLGGHPRRPRVVHIACPGWASYARAKTGARADSAGRRRTWARGGTTAGRCRLRIPKYPGPCVRVQSIRWKGGECGQTKGGTRTSDTGGVQMAASK